MANKVPENHQILNVQKTQCRGENLELAVSGEAPRVSRGVWQYITVLIDW